MCATLNFNFYLNISYVYCNIINNTKRNQKDKQEVCGYVFSCIQYKSRIMYKVCGHVFSCIQYKSRIMYKVGGHVFSCIQYKSRIMYKVCGDVFSCIQYKSRIMYKVCGHVFSCIQYKSRIMYYNICIEITLLFIGINKYLLRDNIPFCFIWVIR